MAEAMHKEGLHDPLEVVETPIVEGIRLHRVNDTLSSIAKVLVDIKEVKYRI